MLRFQYLFRIINLSTVGRNSLTLRGEYSKMEIFLFRLSKRISDEGRLFLVFPVVLRFTSRVMRSESDIIMTGVQRWTRLGRQLSRGHADQVITRPFCLHGPSGRTRRKSGRAHEKSFVGSRITGIRSILVTISGTSTRTRARAHAPQITLGLGCLQ